MKTSPGCVSSLTLVTLVVLGPLLFLNLMTQALGRLGLQPGWVPPLVLAILLGSQLNLPLWSRTVAFPLVPHPLLLGAFGRLWMRPTVAYSRQVVAINLGGGLIPALLGLYELDVLANRTGWPGVATFLVLLLVVVQVAWASSQVIPGRGVSLRPVFPAVTSALLAVVLLPGAAPSAAFAAGVWGVLIGADLVRLRAILDTGIGVVSIGGAGTFDGILLTGILSVFLV